MLHKGSHVLPVVFNVATPKIYATCRLGGKNPQSCIACGTTSPMPMQEPLKQLSSSDALMILADLADQFGEAVPAVLKELKINPKEVLTRKAKKALHQEMFDLMGPVVVAGLINRKLADKIRLGILGAMNRKDFFGWAHKEVPQATAFRCAGRQVGFVSVGVLPGYKYFPFINGLAGHALFTNPGIDPEEGCSAVDRYQQKMPKTAKRLLFGFVYISLLGLAVDNPEVTQQVISAIKGKAQAMMVALFGDI